MEILVLGLPRTGTQCTSRKAAVPFANTCLITSPLPRLALADALDVLGYKNIYHMREVGKNQHQTKWIEALEAKFEGKGKQFGREEFDSFLSGYSVCSTTSTLFVWG